MSYKKTRLIPGKLPDETIQKEFVDWYLLSLKEAVKGKHHMLFYDPVHQLHNTINGKCWQLKGSKGTIQLPSNTGRKRVTVLGAINPINMKFTSIIMTGMCDKEVTKKALENIREDYPDKNKIILIVDNAAYNRAYEVQDYAKALNIEIKYLPPYSPNLNLIERLWKFLKKIFKNRYIENFNDFVAEIESFCKNFDCYYDEISKIISTKIQIIKAA